MYSVKSNGHTKVILFPRRGKRNLAVPPKPKMWAWRTLSSTIIITVRQEKSNVFRCFFVFDKTFWRRSLVFGDYDGGQKIPFKKCSHWADKYGYSSFLCRMGSGYIRKIQYIIIMRTGSRPHYYQLSFLALYSLYISSTASRALATGTLPLGKQ